MVGVHCFLGIESFDVNVVHLFGWRFIRDFLLSEFGCLCILADQTFCHCFFIWPFAVLSDSGKCLLTVLTVTPSKVM